MYVLKIVIYVLNKVINKVVSKTPFQYQDKRKIELKTFACLKFSNISKST